jgi:geranylgeranyl pyrophosphate synthase
MKTAALISAACAMGGVAAGAPDDAVRSLADYGRSLGLAFQIVDDLLDVAGDPARTGKARGADEARRKATYVSVHGAQEARALAELAGEEARAALAGLPGDVEVLEAFVAFVVDRLH